MLVYTSNPSTWESGTGGLKVQDQIGLRVLNKPGLGLIILVECPGSEYCLRENGSTLHTYHLWISPFLPWVFPSMKCRSTAVRMEDTPQSPLPVAGPWQHVQLKWEVSSTIIDLGGGRARIQTNVSIHVGFHPHTGSCVCLFVIKLRLASKLPLFLPQPLSVGNTGMCHCAKPVFDAKAYTCCFSQASNPKTQAF